MTMKEAQDAINLVNQHESLSAAAREAGIARQTLQARFARAKQILADPSVIQAAKTAGVQDIATIGHFWKITKDEHGNGYSVFVKNPLSGQTHSLVDLVRETIEGTASANAPKYPKRKTKNKGENLLVLDLADVHFGKLSVKTETGHEYSRDIARGRVIEGTKALLDNARGFDVGRILFVLGNDILHTDNARRTTTSGTPQDVDGSLFQSFKDAALAISDAIEMCAEVADVDLLHCMSNHDWTHGWALSQTIAAQFQNHPHVNASEYNLSEIHRKYYRFGSNLLGLSHGDGAKEEKLYGAMVTEARQHISECRNLYWHLHHIHHKHKAIRDGSKPFLKEKDHNGITAVVSGVDTVQGAHVNIEYVRSLSPPDGWHDRNGYLNRQGVEAFIYHPHEGQKVRLTEWM